MNKDRRRIDLRVISRGASCGGVPACYIASGTRRGPQGIACWKTVTSGVIGELEGNGRPVLRWE